MAGHHAPAGYPLPHPFANPLSVAVQRPSHGRSASTHGHASRTWSGSPAAPGSQAGAGGGGAAGIGSFIMTPDMAASVRHRMGAPSERGRLFRHEPTRLILGRKLSRYIQPPDENGAGHEPSGALTKLVSGMLPKLALTGGSGGLDCEHGGGPFTRASGLGSQAGMLPHLADHAHAGRSSVGVAMDAMDGDERSMGLEFSALLAQGYPGMPPIRCALSDCLAAQSIID